ncbi:hypothetical protein DN603_30820 [Raoultella planticola]|uniref:Zinc ribbon domain-containing protein n=1 Tax=Raoultella planticola TaxID=575 RepID=A0A443VD38_RAOPL|nr:hypothetical protein DN603_30820 [Raoultella planticola]
MCANVNDEDRDVEPIFGFSLFGLLVVVVTVVAAKRNGIGIALLYLIGMCVIGFGLVVLTSNITSGNGIASGFAAFISPLLGLLFALSSSTSERRAVLNGEAGEYKKCPFCAESVRKEAVKCKHCGSDLNAQGHKPNE